MQPALSSHALLPKREGNALSLRPWGKTHGAPKPAMHNPARRAGTRQLPTMGLLLAPIVTLWTKKRFNTCTDGEGRGRGAAYPGWCVRVPMRLQRGAALDADALRQQH